MARIFVTGDTHGTIDTFKFHTEQFSTQKQLTREDYMIIAGDCAIIWDGRKNGNITHRDQKMIDYYEDKPWTTLFLDGNHENHKALARYPVEMWNGGKIHRISDHVIHLMRGQIFELNQKSFFVMGGADSVDKAYRTVGRSWWAEEMPSEKEYQEALTNLEKHDMSVDYVLTHCCATSYLQLLTYTMHPKADELTQFFDHLELDLHLTFQHWYFGHHHVDRRLDTRHTCLYYDIIEIV